MSEENYFTDAANAPLPRQRVTIHISPDQRRLLIAGLPVGTAVFALDRAGSFTIPTLPHVVFVPVLTPAALEDFATHVPTTPHA